MKKTASILLSLILLINIVTVVALQPERTQVSIYFDNVKIDFPVPPVIVNGRIMAPLRRLFEYTGAKVSWDNDLQKVTVDNDSEIFYVILDDANVYNQQGNVIHILESSPYLENDGYTMLPLRFIAEKLGMTVEWNEKETSAYLISELKKPEPEIKPSESPTPPSTASPTPMPSSNTQGSGNNQDSSNNGIGSSSTPSPDINTDTKINTMDDVMAFMNTYTENPNPSKINECLWVVLKDDVYDFTVTIFIAEIYKKDPKLKLDFETELALYSTNVWDEKYSVFKDFFGYYIDGTYELPEKISNISQFQMYVGKFFATGDKNTVKTLLTCLLYEEYVDKYNTKEFDIEKLTSDEVLAQLYVEGSASLFALKDNNSLFSEYFDEFTEIKSAQTR